MKESRLVDSLVGLWSVVVITQCQCKLQSSVLILPSQLTDLSRNVYFMESMLSSRQPDGFSDIPGQLHMLQHVYRSANYTKPGHYVKCFHDTQQVLSSADPRRWVQSWGGQI